MRTSSPPSASPVLVPRRVVQTETRAAELAAYVAELVHAWSKTLTVLAFTLVPIFFILDSFMMPPELLGRFAIYRGGATVAVIAQHILLRLTRPSRLSVLHGYFITLAVGGTIALMTTDLGGFSSTYYAGLNLVTVAVTILLPWGLLHSTVNALLVLVMYVGLNVALPSTADVPWATLLNNLFFMSGTAVIAVAVSYVKHRLVQTEFLARQDLRAARDALWGEMEVAKRIQTSLLPKIHRLRRYEVAASMVPATEVGGDYYDVIESPEGRLWISIGDVSGHGVESGLIMMMAQTSLATVVHETPRISPSAALVQVNRVLHQNIQRLGADRYMTVTALALGDTAAVFAGQHQDLLVYRAASRSVERVPTRGTWLGVRDDVSGEMSDAEIEIAEGDLLLLHTDGVTEAQDASGRFYGEERLMQVFARCAELEVGEIVANVVRDVLTFAERQDDDVTVVAIRRRPAD
ncbi:MAG: PP2C family protein-serine/threonine phosphatase [Myxococcota bacterium]